MAVEVQINFGIRVHYRACILIKIVYSVGKFAKTIGGIIFILIALA